METTYMGVSYDFYKDDICNYIKNKFRDKTIKILDVGAGSGTYWNYLHNTYENIDCVEVFQPYIEYHKLQEKYKNVYNCNILDLQYDNYDLIIFGDIIEHLTVEEAQKVLQYAFKRCKEMIIAVPYKYKQGMIHNNEYEIHKQDDLTPELMCVRYPMVKLLFNNDVYGYYIKDDNYEIT